MAEVEVEEVLRLWGAPSVRRPVAAGLGWGHIPCVTKLPKFLPTMQCHVGPLRSSNYIAG